MWDQLDATISDFIVNQLFLNMFRNNWLTIKSLIFASSCSHIYLLIKDARSLEHKNTAFVCKLGDGDGAFLYTTLVPTWQNKLFFS